MTKLETLRREISILGFTFIYLAVNVLTYGVDVVHSSLAKILQSIKMKCKAAYCYSMNTSWLSTVWWFCSEAWGRRSISIHQVPFTKPPLFPFLPSLLLFSWLEWKNKNKIDDCGVVVCFKISFSFYILAYFSVKKLAGILSI